MSNDITEEMAKRKQVPEAQLPRHIMDWADSRLFRWELPSRRIPTTAIWTQWTEDERLKEWTDRQLVVDCAIYSGNTAEINYAFTYEQLKEEYLTRHDFMLPPERFKLAPKEALCLKRIPGVMSFLPGVFYEREIGKELFGEGPSWDSAEHDEQTSRTFLVLRDLAGARNLFVRFVYHGLHLNSLLLKRDAVIEQLFDRSDVMASHPCSYIAGGQLVTELYLLLDLAESCRQGYLNQELLLTSQRVDDSTVEDLLDEVTRDELVQHLKG